MAVALDKSNFGAGGGSSAKIEGIEGRVEVLEENAASVEDIKEIMEELPDGQAVSAQVALNTTKLSELDTEIGDLANLQSTAKTNLVAAINEAHMLNHPIAQVLVEAITSCLARVEALENQIHANGGMDIRELNVWQPITRYGHPLQIIGSGAPTAAPNFPGQQYLDTTNKVIYMAYGCNAVGDWAQL